MKWVAAITNFFLPGLGYLIAAKGTKRIIGIFFLLGAIGLTYVEFGIKEPLPQFYKIMFITVLVMNIGFAVDGYLEAQKK